METIQFVTCSLKLDDQITSLHINDYDKTIHKNNIFCKCCDTPMIGKKGTIKQHHFAHKTKANCDSWLQYKTEWHLYWQNLFNIENQEVVIIKDGIKHIADIVSNERVIEVQHSNISLENVQARELFYGDMVWLLDGNNYTYELCDMIDYHDDKITYTFAKIKKAWIQFMTKESYINVGDAIYKIIKHIDDGYFILQRIRGNDFLKIIETDKKLSKGSIDWMKKQNENRIEYNKYTYRQYNDARKWDNLHNYVIGKEVNDPDHKLPINIECPICDKDKRDERLLKEKNERDKQALKCEKARIEYEKLRIENEKIKKNNMCITIKTLIDAEIQKQLNTCDAYTEIELYSEIIKQIEKNKNTYCHNNTTDDNLMEIINIYTSSYLLSLEDLIQFIPTDDKIKNEICHKIKYYLEEQKQQEREERKREYERLKQHEIEEQREQEEAIKNREKKRKEIIQAKINLKNKQLLQKKIDERNKKIKKALAFW